MATNGANCSNDTDMTECDGEKIVTMMDVLQEQEDFEEDANAVLGASDDKDCTYAKGYVKRQAIYACLTCCPDAKTEPMKRAGVCLACSLNCHENHDLVELYTKRNFRCDCGNPKFNSHPCHFTPNKSDLNYENKYNQNFIGTYCVCHRPYPDPEATEEDEMIQCIVCEDWLHSSHLEATVPVNDQYAEMICKDCMEDNDFLYDYSDLAINTGDKEITVTDPDLDVDLTSIFKKPALPNGSKQEEVINDNSEPKVETSDDKNDDVPDKVLEGETPNEQKQDESSADVKKTDESGNDVPQNESKEADNSDVEKKPEGEQSEENAPEGEQSEENAPEGEQSEENADANLKENSLGDSKPDLVDVNELSMNGEVKTDSASETDCKGEKENQEDSALKNTDPTETEQETKAKNLDPETLEKMEEDKLFQDEIETKEINGVIDQQNEKANDEKVNSESDGNQDNVNQITPEKTATDSVENNVTDVETKDATSKDELDKENHVDTKENKRKLSTDEAIDDLAVKKPKLDTKMCVRPRGVKSTYKGAIFWPSNFRQKLCTCNECISMYKDLAVLFLVDPDDTVTAYEALGKEKAEGAPSQYEKGLQALSSLDRVQQINALTEYNKMRDKLLDFLKSFKDRKEIVKEEDIKEFFAGMKPKREPDGVYFCR